HLTDAARRRQLFLLHAAPERTADRARVRRAIEDGAQDVDLAGPRVAVLAEIGIEAQRTVVAALGEAELGEKVHRKDGGVTAVAAAECQDATAQIVDRADRTTRERDDLARPAKVRVAHHERLAASAAPLDRLEERKIRVP